MITPFSSPDTQSPDYAKAYGSILDMIGNTPMVRVQNMDTGPCELYLKLENQNPGGSIKDRVALSMIEAAEKDGRLKPGDTIIEATAGNTGLGLTLIALQKGYRIILVIPDKMSQEKIFHIKAMGAEVIMTRSDVVRGHPDYYQDKAQAIAKETGAYYINQFSNPANPLAHETTTAPEIWEQMDRNVDAVVCGVGSGGTLTGIGRFLKRVSPHAKMVLADPKGSILASYIEHGVMIEPGSWLVEGIGEDFIPDVFDSSLVSNAYTITDNESIQTAQDLLLKEGILCGSSSGTLLAAALKYCRAQNEKKRVVTFVCDSGNKYLSKIFNPHWLNDNGLTASTAEPDNSLRDLIARPYKSGGVVWAHPSDTLQQVYAKMKTFDVSQVPVIQDDRIIGLIGETDVLLTVMGNPSGFSARAGKVMSNKLVTIDVSKPVTDLLAIFEGGRIASVTEDDRFLGLITPIDFLNHLRKRTGKA
ncbi:MAG: cystathionine beta-synthase [Micavibrio aeruginosavorus]|uniref:Cystathionine beta-synthase n=1 Tax=Micavibrio aeruginosavorus TaxID=349221 RepID=A0A2W5A307_9BACT|nr:MAG: cystathionine beta-synthase [Micavibrio aeruginosavorus]